MVPGLRDVATTLAARGLAMAGPFVVSVITAWALGPEGRGHYFLVYSYAQIAAQIANLGLHASNTYLGANRLDLVGQLVINSLYVAGLVAPVATLAVIAFVGPSVPAGDAAGLTAYAAVLLAPLIVAFLFLTNMAVGVGRIALFNGLTISAGVAAVVAAAVAAVLGGGTLDFLLASAAALTASCVGGGVLLLAGTRTRPAFDVALFRKSVAYAVRAYLAALASFLMMRVGVIALQHRSSLEEIGQFSIAMQVADALILLPGTVGLLLFPGLMRTSGEDRWKATWRTCWRLGLVMATLLTVIGLATPFLIPLIFGEAYQRAVPITQALLPSVLIISLVTTASQYLAAEGYPWRQVSAWGVGFVVQAGLSYWLAAPYGGLGVALALATSCALVLALISFEALATERRKKRLIRTSRDIIV